MQHYFKFIHFLQLQHVDLFIAHMHVCKGACVVKELETNKKIRHAKQK